MAHQSSHPVLTLEEIKAATSLAASRSLVETQDTAPQKTFIASEDIVNATHIYKALVPKDLIFERHHNVVQKDADKSKKMLDGNNAAQGMV